MQMIIKNLCYTYGVDTPFEVEVLKQVNLEIAAGTWTAIIGKTGSGKSTLVQHLNGLLKPTSGSVQIGQEIIDSTRKKMPPLYQDVGMVFQYPEHQLFEETLEKDLAYGPKNLGWTAERIRRSVEHALRLVELPADFLQRSPLALSGGQKRRAAIAGVLVMQPNVLILDEPTAGLDPQGRKKILDMLVNWKKEKGKRTIITITHQMEDVAEYADQVVVLDKGEIKWQTDPLNLFTTHAAELQDLGMKLPPAVELLQKLNATGVPPIPLTSVKKAEMIQAIIAWLQQKRQKTGNGQPNG